jgi:hypothetical protein
MSAHGATQVAPMPRFSDTPTTLPPPMCDPIDVDDVLSTWGRSLDHGRQPRPAGSATSSEARE